MFHLFPNRADLLSRISSAFNGSNCNVASPPVNVTPPPPKNNALLCTASLKHFFNVHINTGNSDSFIFIFCNTKSVRAVGALIPVQNRTVQLHRTDKRNPAASSPNHQAYVKTFRIGAPDAAHIATPR